MENCTIVDNYVGKMVATCVDCVEKLSNATAKSPKLLMLHSPNPFRVNGHT